MAGNNIYDMGDTWDAGATTFEAIKMDVADSASASDSLLINLLVGGTFKFKVDKSGNVALAGLLDGRDVAADGTVLDGLQTKVDLISITQAVDLDTVEANAAASKIVTDFLSVTQSVDLDTVETNAAASKVITDFLTVTQPVDLDNMETDIAALANGMVYKGNWDASAGTFPSGAGVGWFYYVSVAGTVDSVAFAAGDNIVAIVDSASTGTYAANWSKHDQTDAVQSVVGLVGAITKAGLLAALNVEDGANAYAHPNHTGDVTSAGDGAQTIAARAVTFAKMQAVATAKVLGRVTAGSGDVEELTGAQLTSLVSNATTTTAGVIKKSTIAEAEDGVTGDVYPDDVGVKAAIDLQVPLLNAGVTFGDIGTYALLSRRTAGAGILAGSTYAGSDLSPTGFSTVNATSMPSGNSAVYGALMGTALSGTWRALGEIVGGYDYRATLFLRIS